MAGGYDPEIPADHTLSGFHARLLLTGQFLTIEDCGSTNGTLVSGLRLAQGRKLPKPDDEIRVGRSAFRVRTG
jgi:pSer/pThr/pTyr-binding forkhead associated (FHA) protein